MTQHSRRDRALVIVLCIKCLRKSLIIIFVILYEYVQPKIPN